MVTRSTYVEMPDNNKNSVEFLISQGIENQIISIKGINDRLVQLPLKINEGHKMKIIQVYVPTTNQDDQEIYQEIENLIKKDKTYFTIIMGDFNARIGKKEDTKEIVLK